MKSHEFRHALRVGRSGLGGNYSNGVFLIMKDGGCLCWKCAVEEKVRISKAAYSKDAYKDGWAPHGFEVNYESEEFCCNCNEQIEAVYGVYNATAHVIKVALQGWTV